MTMLVLTVEFQQIKQVAIDTGVAQYKNPSSAGKKNTGKKQATDTNVNAEVIKTFLYDVVGKIGF